MPISAISRCVRRGGHPVPHPAACLGAPPGSGSAGRFCVVRVGPSTRGPPSRWSRRCLRVELPARLPPPNRVLLAAGSPVGRRRNQCTVNVRALHRHWRACSTLHRLGLIKPCRRRGALRSLTKFRGGRQGSLGPTGLRIRHKHTLAHNNINNYRNILLHTTPPLTNNYT